jgi:hypothetical protein
MAKKKIVIEEIALDSDNSVSDTVNDTHDNAYHYALEKAMTLDEIQTFVDDVSSQLNLSDMIYINLAELEIPSTATVQAIISLNRYACDSDKKIKWQNPTNGFSDAFNNLGFYSEMMKLEFA